MTAHWMAVTRTAELTVRHANKEAEGMYSTRENQLGTKVASSILMHGETCLQIVQR